MAVAPHRPTWLEGRQRHEPELQGLKAHAAQAESDGQSLSSSGSSEDQETDSKSSEEQEVFDPKSAEVESARKPFFDTLEGMIEGFRLHTVLLLLAVFLSFVLAHYGGLRGVYASYALLPVILLASGTLQAHAYKKLRSSWERVPAWAQGELGGVFTKFQGRYKIPIMGFSLPFAHASVATWLALPEAIDPLLDGVTAGSAGSLLNEDAAAAFRTSWQGKACGKYIASWGIEGTLIGIVFFPTFMQLFVQLVLQISPRFMGLMPTCVRWDLNELNENDTRNAMHAADGMTFIAGFLGDMRAACRREFVLVPTGNGVKLLTKVVTENLPSAWFSTSLLGLSLAFGSTGPLSAAVTILSITTSLFTMAEVAYTNLHGWRTLSGLEGYTSGRRFVVEWSMTIFGLGTLCFVFAVAVRVCGALYCGLQSDPALFSLTDGCSQRVG